MPGVLVIGADSAGTFEGRASVTNTRPVCKIYQSQGLFFAVAGLVRDPVTNFDTAAIVRSAAKSHTSIRAKTNAAISAIRLKIPREIRILKTADPTMYQETNSGKREFVTVLLFGLEKGDVLADGFGLKVQVSTKGIITTIPNRKSCPGHACPDGKYIFLLGDHDAIDRHFAAGRPIPNVLSDAVRFLVNMEILENPNDVHPPIDILAVDPTGAKWVCRKAECPDVHK